MRHLHDPNAHSQSQNYQFRIEALIVSFLMIVPLFTALLVFTPDAIQGEIGEDDLLYWPQFQNTGEKRAIYDEDVRGIQDPTIKWDLGLNVLSMGTTAADFRMNGLEDDGYDRDVVHLLFCAENEDGNTTMYIVDGETGESAWELDMGSKTIESGPVVGYVNNNDELDIVFASSDGMVHAFQPSIGYDPEQGEGDRYIWDDFNIEVDKLWIYETEDEILDVSPLLVDLTPTSGDDSLDVVIPARDPDSDTHSIVYALEGNTNDDSGAKIWSRELEGELSSSATSLINGDLADIWIACYASDDEKEYLYSLKGKEGIIQKTITEHATRGYWDMFIPSPAIADIDDDGDPDVVLAVPMDPSNTDDFGTVYVYNLYGEPLNEWKYGVPVKGRIGATPVVGDLKGDGRQYIVVQAWYFSGTTDASTVVTALKRDGSKLWSEEFNTDSDTLEDRAVSSPVLFDMDGNGRMDVVAATNPRVYAFNGTSGDFMPGFRPGRRVDDDLHQLYDSPAIGDFNKDGILDIAIDSLLITHEIAELEIGEITIIPEYPEAGEEIRITADVYNNGTADTANVVIRFLDENETIKEDTHTIPAEGLADPRPRVENYEVSEGWHTFTVIVDPDDEIEEVNQTNNVGTRRIFVAAPYDYTVTADDSPRSAYPRTTVEIPISIENTGTKEDTYSFLGEGLPAGWTYDVKGPLDGEGELSLASRETGNVTVEIDVPDADAGSSAILEFNISSETIEKTISYDLRVNVLQEHDVRFEVVGDTHKSVTPGGKVEFELRITNSGNGIDNYSLSRENPPEDWEANFNIININKVPDSRSREAIITLKAPEIEELNGNNQEADLTLTVSSRDNDTAEETVRVKATISQLAVTDDYIAAFPGENAIFTIEIFNKEDQDDTVDLDAEWKGWDYEFEDNQLFVPAQSKVVTRLNVTVPPDADPETVNHLPISAIFDNQSLTEDAMVHTEARQRYRVNITSFTNDSGAIDQDRFDPGESREYELTFENLGNWDDSYEMTADLPAGWEAVFDPMEIIDMERLTDQTVSVVVTAPASEWAFGNHNLTFWVNSTENDSEEARDNVTLNIMVNRVRSVEIRMNATEFSITPEEVLVIPIVVMNTGNWYEDFSLDLVIPINVDNYTFELDTTEHPYLPFESLEFILTVEAPAALDPQVSAGIIIPLTISVASKDLVLQKGTLFNITVDQVFGSMFTGEVTGSIRPEEQKDLQFRVTNIGNGYDTFTIQAINNALEWEVFLVNGTGNVDSFNIELGPGESWDYTFRITAPDALSDEAFAGYISQSAIRATSENGSSTFEIIELEVEQVYATSIEVNLNDRRIIPEESVNYTLTIRNMGNGDDSINLSNNDPPAHWSILLLGGRSFPLPYGDRVTRTLMVSAPGTDSEPKFGETAHINITAETLYPGDSGVVTVNTTISWVMPNEIEHQIDPDSTKEISYTVMDVEGMGETIRINCDANAPWKVRFSTGGTSKAVALASFDFETIYLIVTSPALNQTTAGDTAPIWINITSPNRDDFIQVTMTVKAVYDFNVTAVDKKVTGGQGDLLDFTFELTNVGNAVDIYTCFYGLPEDDWSGTFTGLQSFDDGDDIQYFTSLDPRGSTQFHLQIQLPEYVEAGKYDILLTVRSDHGKSITFTVNAEIEQVHLLSVETTGTTFKAKDGDDVAIEMEVRNLGNGIDNVTMGVTGLQTGWNYLFTPSFFSFPAQTVKTVTLTVSIPSGSPTEDVDLSIEAQSEGSGEGFFDDITIEVSLQDKPDLTVDELTFSQEKPEDGETFTITAKVSNIGNARARNVVVQFYLDGNLLGEKSVSSILPSTKTDVEYDWKPIEGSYVINVIVDPGNFIDESDELNNQRSRSLEVSPASSEDNLGLIAGILLIVLIGFALFIFKPWDKDDVDDVEKPPREGTKSSKDDEPGKPKEFDYSDERKQAFKEGEGLKSDDEGSMDGGEDPAMKPITKEKPKARISFDDVIFPVILNCPSCKKKIRIVREGKFRCPSCSHIGRVDETGEIVKGDGPKISTDSWDDEEEESQPTRKRSRREAAVSGRGSTEVAAVSRSQDSLFPMRYVCEDCGKKSTVEKTGWYKCPFCGSIHTIDDEGGIDTYEQDGGRVTEREETGSGMFDDLSARSSSSSSSSRSQSTADDWLAEDDGEDMDDELDEQDPTKVITFPAVVGCPSCSAKMRVQQKGTYRCPKCSETFPVGRPSKITGGCPWCGVTIQVKREGEYDCPSCSRKLELESNGTTMAALEKSTKKEWRENPDMPITLDSLWVVLHKFVPDLTQTDVRKLHESGYRSLKDLKGAEEIDLALVGILAEHAKKLNAEMKKF